MPNQPSIVQRLAALLLAITAVLMFGAGDAMAQSASCAQLFRTLQTLERNPDFRAYQGRQNDLRQAQRQEQQVESRYIRQGCNDDAKAGRPLDSQCRALARQITQGRQTIASLQRSVETGDANAQTGEGVLQEYARFDCGNGSSARVNQQQQSRGNLFDQLFNVFSNPGDEDIRGDEFGGYAGYETVRTVCVRLADGYYWPVSYSTLIDYVGNDAQQCQAQCPGAEVELFYYDNPGQEPEQMVSMTGQPYSSLPNAFRYRKEFDPNATCKAPVNYGSINIAETADGQSRAVIQFGDANFPLPLRDPRQQVSVVEAAPTEVAQFVSVPLPRPRPAGPGAQPAPVPVAPVAAVPEERIVKFGDRMVRIVGPDTPYAPTKPTGT
jgi:hypothetical protein